MTVVGLNRQSPCCPDISNELSILDGDDENMPYSSTFS